MWGHQIVWMSTRSGRLWALVLAGGDGTRLQAVTRVIAGAPIPKQYCQIIGNRSLLEATLDRIAPLVPLDRTLAIVNRGHLKLARPQVATLPVSNVLVQPRNLDTGPGILVSLLELARRDSEATVSIFPSDHDIRAEVAFRAHIVQMTRLVDEHRDKIALLGARPDRAETGYGYIVPGPRVWGGGAAFRVAAFHEKPVQSLAAKIIRRGGLWNSFVMVGRVARFIELLREIRPGDFARLTLVPADLEALARAYDEISSWNFSRDFLTRVPEHLVVARADDVGWSDWGTPEAVERTFATMGLVPPWRVPQQATA
jgi:mannose-1-phosphate guanylyltransferase